MNYVAQDGILVVQKPHRKYRLPGPVLLHEEEGPEEERSRDQEDRNERMAPGELGSANLDGQHERKDAEAQERGAGKVDAAELLVQWLSACARRV